MLVSSFSLPPHPFFPFIFPFLFYCFPCHILFSLLLCLLSQPFTRVSSEVLFFIETIITSINHIRDLSYFTRNRSYLHSSVRIISFSFSAHQWKKHLLLYLPVLLFSIVFSFFIQLFLHISLFSPWPTFFQSCPPFVWSRNPTYSLTSVFILSFPPSCSLFLLCRYNSTCPHFFQRLLNLVVLLTWFSLPYYLSPSILSPFTHLVADKQFNYNTLSVNILHRCQISFDQVSTATKVAYKI